MNIPFKFAITITFRQMKITYSPQTEPLVILYLETSRIASEKEQNHSEQTFLKPYSYT